MSRPARPAADASASSPPARAVARDDSDDDDGAPVRGGAGGAPPPVDARATALVAEGEKKAKGGVFSNLMNGTQRFEDANEIFAKAAAQFKMAKNWQEAGDVYARIAGICSDKLKEPYDCAVAWQDAAKCYTKCNTKAAVAAYQQAVDIFMESNKFSPAGKIWKEMGALQEADHQPLTAMQCYQRAADCFEADNNAQSNATSMHIKVADLAAEAEDYKKAVGIYEKMARQNVDSASLRWGVKDYLFRALLCHLAMAAPSHRLEPVSAKLESYVDLCPNLDNTREKGLIEDLIADFDAADADAYADHVFKFDEIMPLDRWKSKVLLDIKRALEGGNPDENQVGV